MKQTKCEKVHLFGIVKVSMDPSLYIQVQKDCYKIRTNKNLGCKSYFSSESISSYISFFSVFVRYVILAYLIQK